MRPNCRLGAEKDTDNAKPIFRAFSTRAPLLPGSAVSPDIVPCHATTFTAARIATRSDHGVIWASSQCPLAMRGRSKCVHLISRSKISASLLSRMRRRSLWLWQHIGPPRGATVREAGSTFMCLRLHRPGLQHMGHALSKRSFFPVVERPRLPGNSWRACRPLLARFGALHSGRSGKKAKKKATCFAGPSKTHTIGAQGIQSCHPSSSRR